MSLLPEGVALLPRARRLLADAEEMRRYAEALSLVIKADSFPIQHAQDLGRRFIADLTAEGNVSGEVQWYYSPTTRFVFNDVRGEPWHWTYKR